MQNHKPSSLKPTHITPFPAPKVSDLPQFKGKHQEDLFWGTYRPNLYLGIRARVPKSLLAGLMWVGVNSNGIPAVRHTCEASDNLRKYGWLRHDGKSYGYQEILDGSILLKTTFVKRRFLSSGYGGDWAVRISVEDISGQYSSERVMPLLFYMAEEAGSPLNIQTKDGKFGSQSSIVSGTKKGVGHWGLYVPGMDEEDVHYAGYSTWHMHNLTELVSQTLQLQARRTGNLQLPDSAQGSSNVAVFQFNGKVPFEIDFVYVSGVGINTTEIQTRVKNLSGSKLSKEIVEREISFEKHFQNTFNLQEKALDDRFVEVGRLALSNLLGGIGYFFGQSRIAVPLELQAGNSEEYWLYWPSALYTAVPSRSMFPRGFLWDEGFHQLLIRRWDKKISMEIVGHWLDLINVDGWIPREQILGSEARSKVPEEFVLQHTSNANPPTLFLAIQDFLSSLSKEPTPSLSEDDYMFLKTCFPRLQAWFNWFNTSQVGKVHGSYFWHGRNRDTDRELNPKTLSSGLDDYPRASHPSPDERHVDLRCWMALAAKSMALISSLLGEGSNNEYETTAKQLSDLDLLNKLHYDPGTGRYYDYGNHTEKVKLDWKVWQDPKSGYMRQDMVRVAQGRPRPRLVPHFGYVSLFPFIMRIIPADSPILEKHLDLIQDEKLLWTEYGLRSLATTSSMYMKRNTEHDPPYWRGPVWINLNYLILGSLHHYSQEPGPYKGSALQIYTQLRESLIRNVADSYYESGYLWEQYDNAAEGKGKGAHPFTGWTSLILLVMAEAY